MKKVKVLVDDKTYEYRIEEKNIENLLKIIEVFSK